MSEEAGFLKAIKADPDDLHLRLVYADWLEERGDARSEYVRLNGKLQELAGSVPPGQWAQEPIVCDIRARLDLLSATFDRGWVAIFIALEPIFVRCRSCDRYLPAKDGIDVHPRTHQRIRGTPYCRTCYEDAVRAALRSASAVYDDSPAHDYHGGSDFDD
jgi:uncharacterized protein (TIGR02996 family)